MNTNDLIGLKYGWNKSPADGSGMTDCFQLVCEIRRRFDLPSYTATFAWAYDTYTEDTLPRSRIARWLLKYGKRITEPCAGAVALFPGEVGSALGTAMGDSTVVYISSAGSVVRVPISPTVGHYFWMER